MLLTPVCCLPQCAAPEDKLPIAAAAEQGRFVLPWPCCFMIVLFLVLCFWFWMWSGVHVINLSM